MPETKILKSLALEAMALEGALQLHGDDPEWKNALFNWRMLLISRYLEYAEGQKEAC